MHLVTYRKRTPSARPKNVKDTVDTKNRMNAAGALQHFSDPGHIHNMYIYIYIIYIYIMSCRRCLKWIENMDLGS